MAKKVKGPPRKRGRQPGSFLPGTRQWTMQPEVAKSAHAIHKASKGHKFQYASASIPPSYGKKGADGKTVNVGKRFSRLGMQGIMDMNVNKEIMSYGLKPGIRSAVRKAWAGGQKGVALRKELTDANTAILTARKEYADLAAKGSTGKVHEKAKRIIALQNKGLDQLMKVKIHAADFRGYGKGGKAAGDRKKRVINFQDEYYKSKGITNGSELGKWLASKRGPRAAAAPKQKKPAFNQVASVDEANAQAAAEIQNAQDIARQMFLPKSALNNIRSQKL